MNQNQLILQKALQLKILNREQLEECLEENRKNPSKDFLAICIEKGYLNQLHLNKLKENTANNFVNTNDTVYEQINKVYNKKNKFNLSAKSTKIPFGKACILLKIATEEQVNDALLAQATGNKKKLGEILVTKGILNYNQVKIVLERQSLKVLICPNCQKKHQIVLFQKERIYRCKKCQTKLEDSSKKTDAKVQSKKKFERMKVMGLTQEISIAEIKGRVDTKGIGFEEEEYKPSRRKISTIKQLERVGLEIPNQHNPYYYDNYDDRPKVKHRKNYIKWSISIILILIVIFTIYFIINGLANLI